MRTYSLRHLSDRELLRDLHAVIARDRATTAEVLAHIAEVDARRLYVPAGYSSMHAYCVHELHLSEDAASKRIQAARKAQQFPAIFAALAEGRLHLTAIRLLAPHLTPENADQLLSAAVHKTSSEIEELLARRFPQSEMLPMAVAIPASLPLSNGHAAGQVEGHALERVGECSDEHAARHVEVAAPRSKVKPHAPGRFALQLTMSQATYDKLQHAQELLSHALPSGDIAEVLDRALDALITKLEKRKFAATERPQEGQRRSAAGKRAIPARVRRAVWERDRGQCTFVGETGHRCTARKFLEFDHVDPVARGGRATVEGIRLRCRAHNQYEAERTFGAGFMAEKREEARRAAATARVDAMARAQAEERARAAEAEARARAVAADQAKDVIAALRELGFRADEARRGAQVCETNPDVTLEEHVRAALKVLCPKTRAHGRVGMTLGMPAMGNTMPSAVAISDTGT